MDVKRDAKGMPGDFSGNIKKAITILSEMPGDFTDHQAVGLLSDQGAEYYDATRIAIFLPIAFCRVLLPAVNWEDQYYELRGPSGDSISRAFSHTTEYLLVLQEVELFFRSGPSSAIILKIASRSSEFKVINELLLQGSKLEDILLTPMSIVF